MNLWPNELLRRLRSAGHVTVLTGAGISAESGIPTFRDAQTGLWARYTPQELATPQAFAQNPERVWQWYTWRRSLITSAQPNAGHRALAALERQASGFTLITQNIDGLHQAAGSRQVIELHGSIHRVRCLEAGHRFPWPEEDTAAPPPCPTCGSPLRPDVVWFGEALPTPALEAAFQAARRCDVFLSIGTSAIVQPAAQLPLIAQEHGALLIEINPQPTPLTPLADACIAAPAGTALPQLVQMLTGRRET